ncbi:MAG: 50S ribosomal protein L6 [Myxococcota bacterium]
MSRIGRLPIPLPAGVEVDFPGGERVRVKGPKGTLDEPLVPRTRVGVQDGKILVTRVDDSKPARAAHGLMRSLIWNMVAGVTEGFAKRLDLIGVGYRAEASRAEVKLNVGFSHPVVVPVPEGLEVKAESPTRLVITGSSKQQVGQFAAELRRVRPPEPYKGKGIRYIDERVRRKVGKAAAGAGR